MGLQKQLLKESDAFLNSKSEERSKNNIKYTYVLPGYQRSSSEVGCVETTWTGFFRWKTDTFRWPGNTVRSYCPPSRPPHRRYNLLRTRPRLLRTWLMAASVHPSIASFRLPRTQRISSIRLWQARTTMVASVSQARERGGQGFHARG